MKKLYKLLVALCAIVLVLPTLSAQALDAQAVFKEIMQKNSDVKQVEMVGDMTVSYESDEGSADIGAVKIDLGSDLATAQMRMNMEMRSVFMGFEGYEYLVYMKDGVTYLGLQNAGGDEEEGLWAKSTSENSSLLSDINDIQSKLVAGDAINTFVKYYDVTETDKEYVVSLKKDINAQEVLNDLNSVVNFDDIKKQMVEQMKKTGAEDSDIAQGEMLFDTLTKPEILQTILNTNPEILTTYDKQTYRPVTSEFNITLPLQELMKQFMGSQATPETLNSVPKNVIIRGKFDIKSVNSPIEVTIPEAALNAEELGSESEE